MQLVTLLSLQQGQSTPWSEQRKNCSPVCSKNMVRSDLNSSCSSACTAIATRCCYQGLAPLSCGSISLPQGRLQNKDRFKISFYLMELVFTGLPKVNSREMNIQECITMEVFVALCRHGNEVFCLVVLKTGFRGIGFEDLWQHVGHSSACWGCQKCPSSHIQLIWRTWACFLEMWAHLKFGQRCLRMLW